MSWISQSFLHSMRKRSSSSAQCHGRPCSFWIYVFTFGLLCLSKAALVKAAFTCPESCNCTHFKDASNVKMQNISCVNMQLYDVPTDKKEGADVYALNLTGNNIMMLTEVSLQYFTNLVELDLSYNQLSFVSEKAFTSLTNLQYLSLEGNDLTKISSALFEIQNLVYLNLARNPNMTFPSDVDPSSSFNHLDISHSSLTDIPASLLDNLADLSYLDLSHNAITSLPADVFSSNTKLETIILEGNSLTVAERDWFQGKDLDHLQELDVSHNAISSVDKNFIKDLNNLVTLDLSNNEIKEIDNSAFKKQKYLESADLSNNLLTTIDKKVFADCKSLKSLDLSENSIESVDSSSLDQVSLLMHLDLSNNNLANISEELFTSVSGLEFLDLSYNSLTTIPENVFDALVQNINLNITNNPYICDCVTRNYLYQLKYDSKVSMFDEDSIKCSENSKEFVFLDWFSGTCSGILGSHGCNSKYECYSRNSDCSDNYCVCNPGYYDNNDIDIGGVCKPMVDLGYPCDLSAACFVGNSECSEIESKICKCKSGYYDTNKDTRLGGKCKPMVQLGENCTMDSMCAPANSHCDDKCDCISTHYDSNGASENGSCLEKIPLYGTCNESYQCAPDNSECDGHICICSSSFYDMDEVGLCQETGNFLLTNVQHRTKRAIDARLQRFCRNNGLPPQKCDASSYYSCYLDLTDGGNKPVEFSELKITKTDTECQEHCFSLNKWHTAMKDNFCLCGSTEGTTITGCCPYSSGTTTCAKKNYIVSVYVTSGMQLKSVPQLTYGVAHQFEVSTTLSVINQIKWNFGDSGTEIAVDGSSSTINHAYTYSGKFTLTVKACDKAAAVCHTVEIPVIVQVPVSNLMGYLTGYQRYQRADVTESITDMTVTFEQGYDFKYIWSRTDSNNNVIYNKGCESGWTAHRQTCLKLITSKGAFNTAGLQCSMQSSSVLQFHFIEEIPEIIDLLSIQSTDTLFINAKRTDGIWKWMGDDSKTFFSDEYHLDDPSIGDYAIIDASLRGLTTSAMNTKHQTICMKDPVDCPLGGSLNTANGQCYIIKSSTVSWMDARDACVNDYNGRLANLKDQSTHSFVASQKSGNTKAWIGLSSRELSSYWTWSDFSSYDNQSSSTYKPSITSMDQNCFLVVDDSTWTTSDCHSLMPYVCEYSIQNERLTAPSLLAGSPDLQSVESDFTEIRSLTTFTSAGTKKLTIFPGMIFTRSGELLHWVIHTEAAKSTNSKLSLFVFRPECSSSSAATLIQPGCEDNMFATCSSSNPTCDPSDICDSDHYFCYLSGQCKSFSESCTCVSESANVAASKACANYYTGTAPQYKVVGQTSFTVDQTGGPFYMIPEDSISVQEGDVIGIQTENGVDVVKCENSPNSAMQQPSLEADDSNWLVKDNYFPVTAAVWSNQSCFIHAVYAQKSVQNLTDFLAYFTTVGSYSVNVTVPYSSLTKSLSVKLDEAVNDIKWVYPVVREVSTSAISLGTVYIEWGVSYPFTLSVGRGTNLQSTWSFNNSISKSFYNSCPSEALSAAPDSCNTSLIWSEKPFSYFTEALSTTVTQDIHVTISNNVGSQTRTLTVRIEKRISGVSITYDTSSSNVVAVNDQATFTTAVTTGTGMNYSYVVEGTPVTGSGVTLSHSFTSPGTFNVTVTVSNILGSEYASLIMTVVLPTTFSNCQFSPASYIAAIGVDLTMSLSCEVILNSVVTAAWHLSDRPTATALSSTETASSSATVTWTQTVAFSTAGLVTVNVTYTDLINTDSMSTTVTVHEAVSSVTLTPSASKALVGDTVTFTATVPPGNYGPLMFTFEYGTGATDTDTTHIRDYFYTNPKTYNVTVKVSNGPSEASVSISFEVVQSVSGVKLSSDGPTMVGNPTLFTVLIDHGTGEEYHFQSALFDEIVPANKYNFSFSSEGNYTVNVTVTNMLTAETDSVLVYVMDRTTIYLYDLKMVGGLFSDCIESGTEHEYTVSVIHFDITDLEYEWTFGDGTTQIGSTSEKHIYQSGNDYNLVLTARYKIYSAEAVLSNTVCVQDRISNPVIVIDKKIGLPASGSVTKTASISVSGTSPVYLWSTDASYKGSLSASTLHLEFTVTGTYYVAVNVSNEINYEVATAVTIEVMYAISTVTIHCLSCTDKNGKKYIGKDQDVALNVSVGSGDNIMFTWDFGDGSPVSTGISVLKSYSAIGTYNITVEAQNDVGAESEYITVHVEEPLTKVVLTSSGNTWVNTNAEKNVLTEFMATVDPSGMEVEFDWVFEPGLTPYSSNDNIASYNYTSTGHKQCEVTARNTINSVSDTFDFFVIEKITSIDLKINGTAAIGATGYVALNKDYTLEITANTQVNVTYKMFLRKGLQLVRNSFSETMDYTFTTVDDHNLQAIAKNNLGSKTVEFKIKVIEEISSPQITVVTGGPSIPLGASISFSGSASGTSPEYSWTYKRAPASETVPSNLQTDQTIILSPGTVGTYVLELSVTNAVSGPLKAEYTFTVIEAVTGVSIHSALKPADAVKINETVTFTAVVSAGSDLNFFWEMDSLTGNQQNFTVTFTSKTEKLNDISVNVSNSASSDFDSVQIYSLYEVPLFDVTVTGSSFITNINQYVAETGNQLNFTSTLVSVAFLTFDWLVDSISSDSSELFSNVFMVAGSYDIMLNASNKISASSSQISVLIQDPIIDFQVSECMKTFRVNEDVNLTARYTKGSSVSVSWDTPDLVSAVGDSAVVSYVAPGTYTVNVTAANYVDTVSLSCQLTIQGIIDNLVLTKSKYSYAGYFITFNVSGNNFDSALFNWTVSGITYTTTSPTWDHIFQKEGDYTVLVTVYNEVSSKDESIIVEITKLACIEPIMAVDGSRTRIIPRAREVKLGISFSTDPCTAYISVNRWSLYRASSCSVALTDEYILSSSIKTDIPSLLIPEVTLPYGSYCAVYENSFRDTPVVKTENITLTIIESELLAVLEGGDSVVIGEGSELQLDASGSQDPDQISGIVLEYTWTCTVVTGDSAVCAAISAVKTSTAALTSLPLTSGDHYTISVTVAATGRQPGVATQQVTVKAAGTPEVKVQCVSCIANGNSYKMSSSVAFKGTCSSGCDDTTTYAWSITSGGNVVNIDDSWTTTKFNRRNLVIKKDGFPSYDTSYTFTLEATTGSKTGSSSMTLAASTVPTGGNCKLSPTTIVPMEEKVNVTCEGWPGSDLLYKIVVVNYDNLNEEYIEYYGANPTRMFYLAPYPESNAVLVKMFVMSDSGSYHAATVTVHFTSPILAPGETMTDFLMAHLQTHMLPIVQQNNPIMLVEYALAVLSFLNEQSRIATDTSELSARREIRALMTTALEGLPRTSTTDIQQMATIADFLTKYQEEILLPETLDLQSNWVMSLTSELSAHVQQGLDQSTLEPDHLLSAGRNILEAYQQDSSGLSTASTQFGDLSKYVPSISTSTNRKMSYASEEQRMQKNVEEIFDNAIKAITIPLSAKLADEDETEVSVGNVFTRAQRVSRTNIWNSINYKGVYLKIPDDVFTYTTFIDEEVFQIVTVAENNPFRFKYLQDYPVTTIVPTVLFMETNGQEILVESLPLDRQIQLTVFQTGSVYYEIQNSLTSSPDYDPLQGVQILDFASVEAGKKFELTNIRKVTTEGAGLHLQLRFTCGASQNQLVATLFKDAEAVETKTITEDMMADKHDHRDFTFYRKPGDSTSETAYKIQVESNHNCNLTLGVYQSVCQFYYKTVSAWRYDGCTATDESIPSAISCKCNHMTSYGGSVLLFPDQIDFTDLTRLDITSNPVAIITCSVIFGLYIIVAIACKRLDHLDVQRISTIPLCGKDGSFKYEVTMVTGRQLGAGTTANVGCRIIGEYGKSASQHLNKKGAFQRTCSDSFLMAFDVNLGELKKVLVWHDNRGTSPSWYLDHVIVKDLQTDKKYYFFSNSWLTLEEEKGTIQKELKAAGAADMMKFGRRMKAATYNSLADKHLWFSLLNRPAQSRFTRIQRATCCVTLLYTFIAVNAMWYGLLKKNNNTFSIGDFGWEEVILGLVSNLMVFPINIGIIFLFKKSRSKPNVFDHGRKPPTAQTIEIENLCDNSQSGSFQSYGAVPSDLERESTLDSLPPNAAAAGLHRSRPMKSQRENTDDTLVKNPVISATSASAKGPMWNQDSIMKWPEKMPYSEDAYSSRPSTSSTMVTNAGKAGGAGAVRKTSVPGTAESDELLRYLDEMESDLKESETKSKSSAARKSSIAASSRKQSQTSRWGSLEDILHSDDESTVTDSSKKKLKKKNSTTSQTSQDKKFNPREEPRINGNGRWLKSRESSSSTNGSMIGSEHFYYSRGHLSSDAGITAGLKPGYHSEMTIQSQDIPVLPSTKEKCTLPSWCIYIAYILCFLLCSFSVIIVILYCFKFGYEESLEWVVAFIFSLFMSVLLIEPFKAIFIAIYMVLVLKKVEQDEDEDCIDIEPTFDNSSEMIKDVKFKPVSGFALLQAKENGLKMHRMKVMLRQFVAYIFYLWLLMVIVYVNFPYSTYLLTKHVENNFVNTENNGYVRFNNISSIEDFWDWTENVFADAVHLQDSQSDEEHGYLLGVARMRLIRSTTRTCEASGSASKLGASSLTDRTCYGTTTFDEDTASYGETWNDSSYNLSWKYSSGNDLGGGHKVGHVGTYGGGGYAHNLGTSLSQTQTVIQDLKSKTWVDLQTRAVILEFATYSPGTDMTALSAMLVEFPLTGGAIASYEIQTQKLLWFQENRVDPLMICEIILLLVTIYSLIHIVISIRDQGRKFFKKFWNWYEMLTTLMTTVAIGMYLGCVVEATNTFNHLLADLTGFTNFERVMYVHVGMRYLHAWLLFLLMFKVVKQLRFVKFLHIYEKTISTAFGQLLAAGLVFFILLLIYAQVGYLMYGQIPGFESVGHSIVTLIVLIRGTFDFWPMLDYQPVFSHFYFYSYYAFTYGLTIALVIAILNNTYKSNRSQMFYKATLDMQDYEMVDFIMKRFKLWAGIQKEKPAFRRVKFPGLPSISSRSSSSYSRQTSSSSSHQSSLLTGQEYSRAQLDNMMARLAPTWLAVVKRFDRIQDLDKEEDSLVKKTESEVKELNFRIRVNGLEKERRELLNWTDKSPDQKQRQSVSSKFTGKDKKPPASVLGARRTSETPTSKTEGSQIKGKRPLSDQGARNDLPEKEKSSASEPRSLQKFFQNLKPSKPAWNK